MESNNDSDGEMITTMASDYEWSVEHEKILIEWADKAMCYRWLHSKSHARYSRLNALYTIPVIIISTLTGTANFAQKQVPVDYQTYFLMIVGGFNLLAGIITTIQQFLKITQLNESHRVSSIAWDKFYRNVKIELAKHPSERMKVDHMIKLSKEEFDRLMETSPMIPDKVVNLFKTSFKMSDTYEKIVKPEICDVLISTDSYRNPWANEENQTNRMQDLLKSQLIKETKQKRIDEINNKMISDFKTAFFLLHQRDAMQSEIIDNLKEKMDLSTLRKILSEEEFV
jgi:ribosomal protein L20